MLSEAAAHLAAHFNLTAAEHHANGAGHWDAAIRAVIRRQASGLEAGEQQAVFNTAANSIGGAGGFNDGEIHDAAFLIDVEIDDGIAGAGRETDRTGTFEDGLREHDAGYVGGNG